MYMPQPGRLEARKRP